MTLFRDTTPLILALTNLPALNGSRPFIDPAGYATRGLSTITWSVVNPNGLTNSGKGVVVAKGWNLPDQFHTTNWFQCLDLELALGTNSISIQAVDWAGNVAMTNFAYVFDTNGDTTPPALTLLWPQDGTQVSGNSFTVQAWMDDDTATVALQYTDTGGIVQTMNGLVERGGNVWLEGVPLAPGTNLLTLTATDAAGNVSTTNFSVVQSSVALTVAPLSQDQMQYGYATVMVTVAGSASAVTVNRVPGNSSDGQNWEVDNVPLPLGGTVTLQATAQMADGSAPQTLVEQERQPVVFTQTFDYNLGYKLFTDWPQSSNAWFSTDIAFPWTRGTEDTYKYTHSETNPVNGDVATHEIVTTWPPDNGYLPSLPGQRVVSDYVNGQIWHTFTQTAPPPPVESMEKSTSSGTWSENYDTSWGEGADRQVRLFTGGRALRQRSGLFDLSASLTYADCLDWYTIGWGVSYEIGNFLWFDDPPVAVPSEDITLDALGPLGSDGHLWTVQPDGIEIVITPEVRSCRSAQALTASPNVATATDGPLPGEQKYKLPVLAKGIPLDPVLVVSSAQFCVGQDVPFALSCLPDGATATNFQWVLEGNFVNQSNQPCADCSVNYTNNHDLLKNAVITNCWWVSGGTNPPDTYRASVNCTLIFTNGNPPTEYETHGQFHMYKPMAKITPWTRSVGVFLVERWQWVMFNSFLGPGITFSNSISYAPDFPGSGLVEWAQVNLAPIIQLLDTNSLSHVNVQEGPAPYLDTVYPYAAMDANGYPVDTPGTKLPNGNEYLRGQGGDTFRMWMLFHPPGGIAVPLRAVDWSWSGSATNFIGLSWWRESGTNSPNPPDYPTEIFPYWQSNVRTAHMMPLVNYN